MKRILLVLLLVFLMASAGWAADTIKIGSLTALTGGLAPFGPPIDYGARLAAAQINGAGGIFKFRIQAEFGIFDSWLSGRRIRYLPPVYPPPPGTGGGDV